ncbi:Asp-tRNA(Asn)/Glu-tRNA(Gln) amidotransferase subunit GatC [Magnetospira thiophila]
MALDKDEVRKIARLARIRVPEEELDSLAGEMSQLIDWVEQLGEVATDGVAPMSSVVHVTLPQRDDVINDGGYPDRVLANAPDRVDDFYTVPKVVEQ